MRAGRVLSRRTGILLVCTAAVFMSVIASTVKVDRCFGNVTDNASEVQGRPDLIRIDVMAAFGKLELPPVTFPHDKHTSALLKEKLDCKICHTVENEKMTWEFKSNKLTKPDDFKENYHKNCIGCHKEMAAKGKATGPPDGLCRSCHNASPRITDVRKDMGLDRVLHFRHVDSKSITSTTPAEKDNCSRCHHLYDLQEKKIFYAKGKEETCRYCHLENRVNNVKSMKQASHLQCVTCHLDLAAKGVKETGPYVCAGCHGAEGQANITKKDLDFAAKLPDKQIPRLKTEQPDSTLLTINLKLEPQGAPKPLPTNPVPFDHKMHEAHTDTCRVCHHASMDPCGKCHTLAGSKDGKFIRLEEAMHLIKANDSCIGCHGKEQVRTACAGCHNHMDKTLPQKETACRSCHMDLPESALPGGKADLREIELSPQQKSEIADLLLKYRKPPQEAYRAEDIPEKVEIKELADKFESAQMPHRKIVLKLAEGMKDNRIAAWFHRDKFTECQGCHHHSPPSKQPPRCGNCHGKPFDVREPDRPGLKGAFHEQCMGCHKSMGLPKPGATACTECHKEKQKQGSVR
jgi:hypothetical protein